MKENTTPTGWSYLVAVLLPIVGVILAIVAWARGQVGPGFALMATSSVGWLLALSVMYG